MPNHEMIASNDASTTRQSAGRKTAADPRATRIILQFLDAGNLENAAGAIIHAAHGRVPFSKDNRARMLGALRDAHAVAFDDLPVSYPRAQILLGVMALAALIDPARLRGNERARELAWHVACAFRCDLEIMRRSRKIAATGFMWSPATWH